MREPRTTWILGVAAVVAVGASAVAYAHRETRIAVKRSPLAPGPSTPARWSGAEGFLSTEIVPDAVISNGGRERLEYHAEFSSKVGSDAAIAWTIYLTNDSGHDLAKLDASQARVGARGTATTKTLAPGELPDGAYSVRVDVSLAASDGNQTSLETFQPFIVVNGKVSEISIDEWATNTHNADLVPLPPGARVPQSQAPRARTPEPAQTSSAASSPIQQTKPIKE